MKSGRRFHETDGCADTSKPSPAVSAQVVLGRLLESPSLQSSVVVFDSVGPCGGRISGLRPWRDTPPQGCIEARPVRRARLEAKQRSQCHPSSARPMLPDLDPAQECSTCPPIQNSSMALGPAAEGTGSDDKNVKLVIGRRVETPLLCKPREAGVSILVGPKTSLHPQKGPRRRAGTAASGGGGSESRLGS